MPDHPEIWLGANLAIENAYRDAHPNHVVLFGSDFARERHISLPRGVPNRAADGEILNRLLGISQQRQPDIIDLTDHTIYEIKTVDHAARGWNPYSPLSHRPEHEGLALRLQSMVLQRGSSSTRCSAALRLMNDGKSMRGGWRSVLYNVNYGLCASACSTNWAESQGTHHRARIFGSSRHLNSGSNSS